MRWFWSSTTFLPKIISHCKTTRVCMAQNLQLHAHKHIFNSPLPTSKLKQWPHLCLHFENKLQQEPTYLSTPPIFTSLPLATNTSFLHPRTNEVLKKYLPPPKYTGHIFKKSFTASSVALSALLTTQNITHVPDMFIPPTTICILPDIKTLPLYLQQNYKPSLHASLKSPSQTITPHTNASCYHTIFPSSNYFQPIRLQYPHPTHTSHPPSPSLHNQQAMNQLKKPRKEPH